MRLFNRRGVPTKDVSSQDSSSGSGKTKKDGNRFGPPSLGRSPPISRRFPAEDDFSPPNVSRSERYPANYPPLNIPSPGTNNSQVPLPLPSPPRSPAPTRPNPPYKDKVTGISTSENAGNGHNVVSPHQSSPIEEPWTWPSSAQIQPDTGAGLIRQGKDLQIPTTIQNSSYSRSNKYNNDNYNTSNNASSSQEPSQGGREWHLNTTSDNPPEHRWHNAFRNEYHRPDLAPGFQTSSESPHFPHSTSSMGFVYPLPQPPMPSHSHLSGSISTSAIFPSHGVGNSVTVTQPRSPRNRIPNMVLATPPRSPRGTLPSTVSVTPPLSPHVSQPRSPKKADSEKTCKWQKGSLLGSGAFGRVYKGIHSETGEFCAIKEVKFVWDDPKSKESAKQLVQEIALLSSFSHTNIVQYKGSELVDDSLYIYLELISGGSLYKLINEFKRLEEPVIKRYTKQILQGLQFLHSRNTVHRDIKCANILVDHGGVVKLADFGLAKYIKEQGIPFSIKGSPLWMAPEVIMQKNTGYEYAVDIWSLGCTVIEMATGKPPWSELEPIVAMFKVTKEAPPIPECLSPDGQSFVRLCLQKDPSKRPPATELLKHPFVQIQNTRSDDIVHAFEALGALDISEFDIGPFPSTSGKLSSLSAPSSPRSSGAVYSTLYPTRSGGFLTPPRGIGSSPFDEYDNTENSRRRRKSSNA